MTLCGAMVDGSDTLDALLCLSRSAGAYGKVIMVQHKQSGEKRAAKITRRTNQTDATYRQKKFRRQRKGQTAPEQPPDTDEGESWSALNEAECLKRYQHKNIIQRHDFYAGDTMYVLVIDLCIAVTY